MCETSLWYDVFHIRRPNDNLFHHSLNPNHNKNNDCTKLNKLPIQRRIVHTLYRKYGLISTIKGSDGSVLLMY